MELEKDTQSNTSLTEVLIANEEKQDVGTWGKGGFWNSVVVIITASLFLTTTPFAFYEAGYGLSFILIGLSFVVNWFTCDLLILCADRTKKYRYIEYSFEYSLAA